MNPSETIISDATVSFSGLKQNMTGSIEKKIFKFEKKCQSLAKSVNDYLKTPEEMDAEFSLEMNMNKHIILEYTGLYDTYGTMTKNKDGNTNTYSPDDNPSGFMEENY